MRGRLGGGEKEKGEVARGCEIGTLRAQRRVFFSLFF